MILLFIFCRSHGIWCDTAKKEDFALEFIYQISVIQRMSNLPGIRSHNILDDFLNPSNLVWFLIGKAPLLWKSKETVVKAIRLFCMFHYGLFSWVRSDFFFILALGFIKLHKKSIANSCGKQSMKTIGTFPLLVVATRYGDSTNKEDPKGPQPITNQYVPHEFDFLDELKLIVSKWKSQD